MSLSTRTRFEVFKRDRFTCSYCGRTPPDVLLEADHVVPRAAGGSDDIANLTTSCQDCNRGKSSVLLDEGTAPVVNRRSVEEMAERVEQARAYLDHLATLTSLRDESVSRVFERWAVAYGARAEERDDGSWWVLPLSGRFPDERSVRTILRRLQLADVLDAVDITSSRIYRPSQDACRYFYGVCWRMVRERDGSR